MTFLFALPVLMMGLGAAHAEPCEVIVSKTNSRLQQITLPDRRTIFMLGSIHGDRQIPFLMADLIKEKAPKMSDSELHAEITDLESKAFFALREVREDLADVKTLFSNHPEIQFVGLETEDRYAESNLENYQLMLTDFRRLLAQRDPSDRAVANDLEEVLLGAAGYLRSTDPEAFGARTFRGFESAAAGEASEKATAATEKSLRDLEALGKNDPEFIKNVLGTQIELDGLYDDYSPEKVDPVVMERLERASMPEQYRSATMAWVKLKLAEMAADKRREHAVTAHLLATGSSGLLIMGSAHLAPIMRDLKAYCKNQKVALLSNAVK